MTDGLFDKLLSLNESAKPLNEADDDEEVEIDDDDEDRDVIEPADDDEEDDNEFEDAGGEEGFVPPSSDEKGNPRIPNNDSEGVDEPEAEDTTYEDEEEKENKELEKQYFGKKDDTTFYYLNKVEKGWNVSDAEGKIVYPTEENKENVPTEDILDFIVQAQKELEMVEVSGDIFARYVKPAVEEEEHIRDEKAGFAFEDETDKGGEGTEEEDEEETPDPFTEDLGMEEEKPITIESVNENEVEELDNQIASGRKKTILKAINNLYNSANKFFSRDLIKQLVPWAGEGEYKTITIDTPTAQKIAKRVHSYLSNFATIDDVEDVYEVLEDYITKNKLDESKVNELKRQGVELRLVHKAETGEWVVKYYENGKYNEDKTYYTDDKEDAVKTMASMQKKVDAKEEGYKIEESSDDSDPEDNHFNTQRKMGYVEKNKCRKCWKPILTDKGRDALADVDEDAEDIEDEFCNCANTLENKTASEPLHGAVSEQAAPTFNKTSPSSKAGSPCDSGTGTAASLPSRHINEFFPAGPSLEEYYDNVAASLSQLTKSFCYDNSISMDTLAALEYYAFFDFEGDRYVFKAIETADGDAEGNTVACHSCVLLPFTSNGADLKKELELNDEDREYRDSTEYDIDEMISTLSDINEFEKEIE